MKFFGSRRAADAEQLDTQSDSDPQIASNPYLNGRRAWNSHTGGIVSSLRMWQIVGLLSLMSVLAAVGGVIHIGSQSKFVPYVVERDNLGRLGTPVVLDRASPVDPRSIEATVRTFIEDARLVTPDIALQRKAIFRVYAHLAPNEPATTKMNEWLNGTPTSNPFKRAEGEAVSTEINSVLPQTPTTWQVDWTETTRDLTGATKSQPTRMRALVTIYTAPATSKTSKEQLDNNPLLIFVRDFSWSKQL